MADFPLAGGCSRCEQVGYLYASTAGTAITADGTTNTKGAWVELLSAANNTERSVHSIIYLGNADSQESYLVDIGVGGAGSEEVLVPNLYISDNTTAGFDIRNPFPFPLLIPEGVRISARCQSSGASAIISVHMTRAYSSFSTPMGFGRVLDIGSDVSDSTGTTVARSTANTFGSWVEMTSSLSNSIKGFCVMSIKNASSWSFQTIAYQVGVGAAASEEIIFSGHELLATSNEIGQNFVSPFIPVQISEGERIAIRAQSDVENADGDLDYVIYGVY